MTRLKRLAPLALALLTTGCAGGSILTPSTEPAPLTTDGALAAFRPIPNSRRAPCEQQRAVAEHNSAYDTLKTGEKKIYKAPSETCRSDGQPAAESRPPVS